MQLSTRILGKTVADAIASRAATPLLTIGKDVFYRRDLAKIGCFNFLAAANLNTIIASLLPRDTRDVFDNVPPSALVVPHMGSISLAVLGAAFEAKGIGGSQPLETWMAKHRPKEATREFVTFSSMKHAEEKREQGEKKARKARRTTKAVRRDQAQRIRGERFIARAERTVTNGQE